MGLKQLIVGRVRSIFTPDYADQDEDNPIAQSPRGELIVSQGMPELAELVRLGESWQAATSVGQAALVALPAALAGLSLINNEAATGMCYVIDSFGSWEAVVDATQTDVTAIFAMLNKRGDAVPVGTLETTPFRSTSGRDAVPGAARLHRAAAVTNNGWFPHSTDGAPQMAAAPAGAQWKINEVRVRGLYIVPPGLSFSIQAVKAAAAAAAQQFFFIRFHRAQLKFLT